MTVDLSPGSMDGYRPMFFLAEYLHRLNPVALRITDSLQIRWYGLAYVAGFVIGWWLLRRWARKGRGELKESEVADFITYAALFGVMLGGRLGYMLLYNRDEFFANPLVFFHLTGGGMASHGGIAGLFFFTLYWAKRYNRSWTGLGDNLVVAAPVGIFFGRMANFVNGELYGRPTTSSWGMKFPEEATRWINSPDPAIQAKEMAVVALGGEKLAGMDWRDGIMTLSRTDSAFAEGLRPLLTLRHPSQLYAAALEGLALFAILFFVRERWPRAPHGMLTGLFFILYAVFRMLSEHWREPDRRIGPFTEGQFYSIFMLFVGAAFLVYAAVKREAPRGANP